MRKLGEIYIELTLNDTKFKEGLARAKDDSEKAGKEREETFKKSESAILNSQKALNQQRLREDAQLNKSILSSQKALNQQRLREEVLTSKSYMQNIIETSKHVIQAAPGYAIATAAITSVYVALRAVTGEFVAGLSAVEDYQVKVASMSAFLTTFNKTLTPENLSQVFSGSTKEAERIVNTMEKLDAKTIATGKDLTTMAEQFIKGGVSIDTVNKSSLDGFTNIANALKLLTQGQNQEIQMRQEIRALVQGQLKDTNILAKTLESIDPNIKEHIKLWKDEGTIIENVGRLLAGFGPAAKELENTWAVVGSTMETIHTRILRGAFKPTYDSLIDTAKAWNKLLMDTNGNLTPLANSLSKILELSLSLGGALIKGVLFASLSLAVGGAAYGAWVGFGVIIASITGGIGSLTAAFTAFTIAMYKNPYFAIGAVVITTAFGFLIKQYIEDLSKVKDEMNKVGTAAEENLLKYSQARQKSDQIMGRIEQEPIENAGINIVPYIPGTISQATTDELIKPLKKYTDELQKKSEKEKDSARATLEAKIKTGELAQSFKLLSSGGSLANSTLEETISLARKYASVIDNKKYAEQSEQASKKLTQLADSLRVKDSALDKSKSSEIAALLSTTEYRKAIEMTGVEGKKLAGVIMSLAVAYDENKTQEDAVKTLENYISRMKEKIVGLKGGKSALEEYRIEEGKISDAFKQAGEKGDEFKNVIKELGDEFSSLVKTDELNKLQAQLDKLRVSILPEKEENKTVKLRNELDKLVADYAKLGKDILPEVAKLYDELNQQGTDWVAGAIYGLKQYSNTSDNVFKTAENVVTKSFKGMEDALVEFVKTGKVSFTDMVDSMVTDLIRLSIQKSITGPLAEGFANSGIMSSIGSGVSSLFGFANGAAFNGISGLSNQVISSPTMFSHSGVTAFANGGSVLGEAGPEAVMPLQRTSSGKLGVIASGGSTPNVTVNVIESPGKGGTSNQRETPQGLEIDIMVDQLVAKKQSQRGSASNKAMRQNFGAREVLVAR